MSLLNKLSGKSGEDISTEILAYLLSSKDRFVPFQRLFFNRILNRPLSSIQLQAETQTQTIFEAGRPDLLIMAEKTEIILENKLGAYLSGDNQLVSYCKVFQEKSSLRNHFPLFDIETIKQKILIFLAPQKIIDLSISASDKACKNESGIGFKDFLKEVDVTFMSLSWEEVLNYLDLNDSLQYELYLFVRGYINQELTQEEKMVLENPHVPAAINKVLNYIDELRNIMSAKGWSIGRMSQSYLYYGFYIETEVTKLYFGYFLPLWETYKTPIFLQIREAFIKTKNKEHLLKTLKNNLFEKDKEHEFIRPFRIDSIELWKDELHDILRAITSTA